jgi:hypothetical protein
MHIFWSISPMFFSSSFKVSGLTWRPLIYFELTFVHMRDRDLVSSLLLLDIQFPSTTCERGCLFSNICFCYFCEESDGRTHLALFLDLLLHWFYVSVFVPVPGCFCYYGRGNIV